MDIQKLTLEALKPYPKNPRKDIGPGAPVYESLKKSIQLNGCVVPLVYNQKSGYILGGNLRYKVLKDLGYKDVEIVSVSLDPQQEIALNIGLNKISNDWDYDMLAEFLDTFLQTPAFDFQPIGFDLPEISEILDAQKLPDAEDDFNLEASLAAIDTPVTQCGDLIELGVHRVLCGDSSKPEDLKMLMGDYKVNLLV